MTLICLQNVRFDFGGRRADRAEMHAALDPFLEEDRLHGIGGAGDDLRALAGLFTRVAGPDLPADRGTHLLRKRFAVLLARTEDANIGKIKDCIET